MSNKYLIFGTGLSAEHFLHDISAENMDSIIGFVDNDVQKHGKEFLGRKIYSVANLASLDFDKVIIANIHFNEIKNQLQGVGLPEWKIDSAIDFFSDNFAQYIELEKSKKKLNNKSFSLISNSCFGVLLCRKLGVKYNSPFIGTYIVRPHYLNLLQNLEYYLSLDLQTYKYPQNVRGKLGDVEIIFPHERDCCTVQEKWARRIQRFDFGNMFIHAGKNYSSDINEQYSLKDMELCKHANKLLIGTTDSYISNGNCFKTVKGVIDLVSWFNFITNEG